MFGGASGAFRWCPGGAMQGGGVNRTPVMVSGPG